MFQAYWVEAAFMTPQIRYIPRFGGKQLPLWHQMLSYIHTKLWEKHLPPSAANNKPSIDIMVIQGREKWDKYATSICRLEGWRRWVIFFLIPLFPIFVLPLKTESQISKMLVLVYSTTWHDITEDSNFCVARCFICTWLSLYNK